MNRRTFLIATPGGTALLGGCVDSTGDGDGSESTQNETSSSAESTEPDGETDLPTDETIEPDGEKPIEPDGETVTPGDAVERSFDVENEGSDPDSVLVTLTAVDPRGRPHIDDADGHETVSLDPGESREVTLSWTPDEEVPEGEYDLLMEVWMETDLDERVALLSERTEPDAITVEKPNGTLSVSTTPPDATVFVDRELLAASTIELPVGSYEVIAIHEEYETATETVTIEEAETTAVEIDLTGDDRA